MSYSSIADNKNFHKQAEDSDTPYLYSLLSVSSNKVNSFKKNFNYCVVLPPITFSLRTQYNIQCNIVFF